MMRSLWKCITWQSVVLLAILWICPQELFSAEQPQIVKLDPASGLDGGQKPQAAGFGVIDRDKDLMLYLRAPDPRESFTWEIVHGPNSVLLVSPDIGNIWREIKEEKTLSQWVVQPATTQTEFAAFFKGLLRQYKTAGSAAGTGKTGPKAPKQVAALDFGVETSDVDIDSDTDNRYITRGSPARRCRATGDAGVTQDKYESVGESSSSTGDVGMIVTPGEQAAYVDVTIHPKVPGTLTVESSDAAKVNITKVDGTAVAPVAVSAETTTKEYLVQALAAAATATPVKISAKFVPDSSAICGSQIGEVKDEFNVNIRELIVHPRRGDFQVGKEGRILISAKEGGGYNTSYQVEDGKIIISAEVTGEGSNRWVYFLSVDPPDASPYEAGAAGDNRDTTVGKRGTMAAHADFVGGDPKTVDGKQVGIAVKTKQIGGKEVAKAVLTFTNRYSGDNYVVKARIGTDFPSDALDDSCPKTALLTAWKRLYLEHRQMFKKGATVLAQADNVLTVDSVADFSKTGPNSLIQVWSKTESVETTITDIDATNRKITAALGGKAFPKYSGVLVRNQNAAWANTRAYIPDGFGNDGSGNDGGAFVEFAEVAGGGLPRYAMIPSHIELSGFIKFWFTTRPNVFMFATGDHYHNGTGGGTWGPPDRISIVFWGQANDTDSDGRFYREAEVHELAHQVTVNVGHVDTTAVDEAHIVPDHAGLGACCTTYGTRARQRDGIAEFCRDHLNEIRNNPDPR